ncbi:putative nucleotide catabolic process [Operophtera brumata]|uniref:Putative nucleotide catabolic process n=1 Tax=Operophtera brumata TaxID=104452 RepID=A0A0L7KRZ4_OPEBR|nr:putative nucleotide catabolic process [Operophtera brumata]
MAIQNHFAAINVRTGKARPSKHRQSLVTLSRRSAWRYRTTSRRSTCARASHAPPSTASRSSHLVEGTLTNMCLEIGMAIQNHFAAINVRTGKSCPSKHR